jgi:hypothetical protein
MFSLSINTQTSIAIESTHHHARTSSTRIDTERDRHAYDVDVVDRVVRGVGVGVLI